MKGEDNETIKKELDKIEACGIREVCLESRPHPDFCGPKWWENPELSVYEKVAFSPLLWCNSGADQAEGLSGLPEELYR